MMSISILPSLSEFRKQVLALDCFGQDQAYVFQHVDVVSVWLETIGRVRHIEPYFVCVTQGENSAYLCLGISNQFGLRKLSFLDHGVSDYNAPILAGKSENLQAWDAHCAWPQIIAAIPKCDVAMLHKMPRTIGLLPNPFVVSTMERHNCSGHVATLQGTWEEFRSNRIPRHFRQENKRRRRRLQERGDLRFVVAQSEDEKNRFFETMLLQKRRKYSTQGVDPFPSGGENFYREITRRLCGSAMVHLSALLLNDNIIATHWGYVDKNRFYHLLPTHDIGEWGRYSPGHILHEHLIEWSFQHGLKYSDFGIGDEAYKDSWCDTTVDLFDLEEATTVKGRIFLASQKAIAVLKSIESLRTVARFLKR